LSEDEKVARVMGFKKFRTTKDTKIPGNEFNYAVRKEKQTMYRQYMNRQGGFNRPLSPG
jgi:U4/U6.U5 tri-snRNP-associated protein 3